MDLNEITREITGAALEAHRRLGPGLLESAYVECLCCELTLRGLQFNREVQLPLNYNNVRLDCGYRVARVVCAAAAVEMKAVEALIPQLLTYMRLVGWKLGLLINFNVSVLKNGVRRLALGLEEFSAASAPLR